MELFHNPIVVGLVGLVLPAAFVYLWNLLLPRERVYDFGYRMMSVLMAFTVERIGAEHGRKILDRLGNTLTDLTTGMRDATLGKYSARDAISH